MAVRNEERAFAFWSYVAAHAQAPEIRRAAEAMAHEELGHVAILRQERRNAFHAARRQPEAQGADGMTDLATLERRLADLLEFLVDQAPPEERGRLIGFAEEARQHADDPELASIPTAVPDKGIPGDPVALAELLVDRYLEAGDSLKDDTSLAQVQELAGHAIARLVWLRSDLPELHDGRKAPT
jgi:hypothetical protein